MNPDIVVIAVGLPCCGVLVLLLMVLVQFEPYKTRWQMIRDAIWQVLMSWFERR